MVLPAPFGPTSAAVVPSPMRKLTSFEQRPPVRQDVADVRYLDVPP